MLALLPGLVMELPGRRQAVEELQQCAPPADEELQPGFRLPS